MSTSLATLRQALSVDIGDTIFGSCASTTTSSGSSTTIVDTALTPLPPDFFRPGGSELPSWFKLTSGTYSGETRAFSSISTSTVTVSVAYSGTVASAVTYEIHRLCHPDLKDKVIQLACYDVFPYLYTLSDTSTFMFGNWLIDGHMDDWSSSSALTYWTASSTTLTRTSNTIYGGTYVCALSTATGYVGQSATNNPDLLQLASKTVTFRARVYATTASQVRLAVYDSVTGLTYSDYHGGTGWEWLETDPVTIADHPSDVAFRVYYASIATTAYVTDCCVTGPEKYEYDISYLDLVNGTPNAIYLRDSQDTTTEFPNPLSYSIRVNGWVPMGSGKIRFTEAYDTGRKMRILGRKHITQPDSTTSTDVDAPYTDLIIAYAAKRLYGTLKQTAPISAASQYKELESDWEAICRKRRNDLAMPALPITNSGH